MVNSFGELIERERKKKGWSYDRLSQETERFGNGLSSSYLYRLVKGKQNNGSYDPTTKTVKVLMDALQLDIVEVLQSIGFGEPLKDLYYEGFIQPVELKELLLYADLFLEMESIKLKTSRRQKKLIGDFIYDLFEAATDQEKLESFSSKSLEYAKKLGEFIAQDEFVIELGFLEDNFEINVEVMIKKYEITKEEIIKDLNKLDTEALFDADSSFPLFLVGEHWLCEKNDSIITVIDKISELSKLYRKD
jgi:transcriptional regulator with XRE-family HTH domain